MTLLYVLFAKVVPIISIWELKAGASGRTGDQELRTCPARQKRPGPALGEMHP